MIYCNEGQSRTINFGPIENCLNTVTTRYYDSLTHHCNQQTVHLPVCQYRYFPRQQSFKLFPLTGTLGPFECTCILYTTLGASEAYKR